MYDLNCSVSVFLPQVVSTLTLKLLSMKVAISVPMALSSPLMKHLERQSKIVKLVREVTNDMRSVMGKDFFSLKASLSGKM